MNAALGPLWIAACLIFSLIAFEKLKTPSSFFVTFLLWPAILACAIANALWIHYVRGQPWRWQTQATS